jgi:hypothetical protein
MSYSKLKPQIRVVLKVCEHLGAHPLIYVDQNGLLGVVVPSREFRLANPPLPGITLPVTIVHDVTLPSHSENFTGDMDAPD